MLPHAMSLDDLTEPGASHEAASRTEPSVDERSLRIRCANCGEVLAVSGRTIRIDGTSTPVFVNPTGVFFELLLLEDAVNVLVLGPPTTEATWFPGRAWQYVLCRLCLRHVGWRWGGSCDSPSPPAFWGFIRPRILLDWPEPEGTALP